MRGQYAAEPVHHFRAKRCADAVGVVRVSFQPPVMEHHAEFFRTKVEQGRRVAGNALFRRVFNAGYTVGAQTASAIAQTQRQAVTGAVFRVVAGRAGNLFVAA